MSIHLKPQPLNSVPVGGSPIQASILIPQWLFVRYTVDSEISYFGGRGQLVCSFVFPIRDQSLPLAEDTKCRIKLCCEFAPLSVCAGVGVFVYVHSITSSGPQLKLLSPIIIMPRSDEWAAQHRKTDKNGRMVR